MYNPSRGGVRGGADQFSWDSVKNDKHRENYLGHSLMAPIGRWQKGKDLTWYDKKRNDSQEVVKRDKLEMQEIKRAEQEAMLIALGHSVVQKDTQRLTKEEMKEALKRNSGERDALNIERIDGVGVSSARTALLMGGSKQARRNEGVMFENHPQGGKESQQVEETRDTAYTKKKKSKKSSKKHKKQKKLKKTYKRSSDSDDASDSGHQTMYKNSKTESDIKEHSSKKIKRDNKHYSVNYSDSGNSIESKPKHSKKRRDKHKTSNSHKKRRHDTSESDS